MLLNFRNLKTRIKKAVFHNKALYPSRGPDFIVTGMTRSGTTYLYNVLKQHPDIFLPSTKEVNYFNHEGRYKEDLDGYFSLFYGYQGQKSIGEITPSYIELENQYDSNGHTYFYRKNRSSHTPIQKIRNHLPDAKIIVSLRDPLSRAISFYSKNWLQGRIKNTLQEEILEEHNNGTSPLNLMFKNRYDLYLENAFKYYPKDNIHVMIFEEWIGNQAPFLNELVSFIDLPPLDEWKPLDTDKQNKMSRFGEKSGLKGQKPPIELDHTTLSIFKKTLRPTKDYVENLIGRPVSWDV